MEYLYLKLGNSYTKLVKWPKDSAYMWSCIRDSHNEYIKIMDLRFIPLKYFLLIPVHFSNVSPQVTPVHFNKKSQDLSDLSSLRYYNILP